MLIEAIALGLLYSFFLFEWLGLVAGGLVAPGYIALSFDRPLDIALCLFVALTTLFLMRLLSMITILFGRRRFILCILIGFFMQWSLGSAIIGTAASGASTDVVGYIIPGLLANEMERQGIGQTLMALLFLSGLVWLSLQGLRMVF